MHPEHCEVFNQGCSFSHQSTETNLTGQTKTKRQNSIVQSSFPPLLSIHMYGHSLYPVKLKLVEIPSFSEPQCIEPEVHYYSLFIFKFRRN